MRPKGHPKRSPLGPWGTQKSTKATENTSENTAGIRARQKSPKVWKSDPPEPQKVGFGLRGTSISTKPPKSPKGGKSNPKGSKNCLKESPKGQKDPPRTLRNVKKSGREKDAQKELQKNLS